LHPGIGSISARQGVCDAARVLRQLAGGDSCNAVIIGRFKHQPIGRLKTLVPSGQSNPTPLQNHRMTGDIVYGWGFSGMTRFATGFKAMYDVRNYRNLHKC
jgi:hypothetical protein